MSCKIEWEGKTYDQAEFLEVFEKAAGSITPEAVAAKNPTYSLREVQTILNIPGSATASVLEMNKDVVLDETDPDKTVFKKNGTSFTKVNDNATADFSSIGRLKAIAKQTMAEWAATKYYKKRGVNTTENIKWEDGKEVSFKEVVALCQDRHNTFVKKSNIINAIIEYQTNPSNKALGTMILDAMSEAGLQTWEFKWINDLKYVTETIGDALGFKVGDKYPKELRDRVTSGVKIASETMGLASRIGLMTEHSNNSISLTTVSTGDYMLKDLNAADRMRHASHVIGDIILDNNMDKAKLELMFQAVILKEQDPTLRFRELSVVHLAKGRKPVVYKVSKGNYLSVIEDYYEKTNPTLHASMKAKGLFDLANYTADSKGLADTKATVEELSKFQTNEEQINYLAHQISILELEYEDDPDSMPPEARAKIKDYTAAIIDLQKVSTMDIHADGKDMSLIKRMTSTLFDVNHPMAQLFSQLFTTKRQRANEAINKVKFENYRRFKPVLKEWLAANPGQVAKNIAGLGLQHHREDGTGLSDFMWEKKTVNSVEGNYATIISESKPGVYTNETGTRTFTKAQYEYNKWYRDTMKAQYEKTLKKKVTGTKTKEMMIWGYSPYNKDFMPRIPKQMNEVLTTHGITDKKSAKVAYDAASDYFIKERYQDQNQVGGVPVRYVGSDGIIANEAYSMDAGEAFMAFMSNMIEKDELDELDAVSKGIVRLMETEKDAKGRPMSSQTIGWIKDFTTQHVRGLTSDEELFEGNPKGARKRVNTYKILNLPNNMVTWSTMILSPATAGFNFLLGSLVNTQKAIVGSIAKRSGLDYEMSVSDLAYGIKEFFKSGMLGKFTKGYDPMQQFEAQDKMLRLVDHFQFSSNTYNTKRNQAMTGVKNQILDKSNLYILHTLPEEAIVQSVMVAQMHSIKLQDGTGKYFKMVDGVPQEVATRAEAGTMYDAYIVNEDTLELEYKGPQRGVLADGTPLMGLTPLEIAKMKRTTQRMHGAYREDERTALESYLVGRWIMKFRKYLPTIINNNFQGAYADWSVGKYEKLFDPVTRQPRVDENGMTLYEWQAQVNEGRVWVFAKFIAGSLGMKFSDSQSFEDYKWDKMKPEQKRIMYDIAVSVGLSILVSLAGNFMFDDEDKTEKNPFWLRYQGFVNNVIQIWPGDIMRTFSSPLMQFKYVYDMMHNGYRFFFDGLIAGERLQTGPNAGRYPGSTWFLRRFPLINVAYRFDWLSIDDSSEAENASSVFDLPAMEKTLMR